MKLLLDENLSPLHALRLRESAHDVVSVADLGLCGADDAIVRQVAIRESRILVTLDGDFANVLRFPVEDTPGVIRLRVHPPTEDAVAAVLSSAIRQLNDLNLTGRLVIVDGRRIRIRG